MQQLRLKTAGRDLCLDLPFHCSSFGTYFNNSNCPHLKPFVILTVLLL